MRRQSSRSTSRGYSILELTIGLAILSTVVVAGLRFYKEQVDLDQARILAKVYQNMNAAIGNYLTLYYFELRSLPPVCSTLTLAEGGGPSGVDLSNCALDIPDAQDQLNQINSTQPKPPVRVANAMQPTVTELVRLGLLHRQASEIPPYAHHKTVRNSQGTFEPFRFAFLLEHVCVAAPRIPAVKNLPQCTEANQDLRTYVFNTQPYHGPNASDAAKQASWLGEVAVKAGPDAAMTTSITPNPGELYGYKGAWELKNPLRNLSTSKGVTSLVVMVNGFGASGFLQFTRRDGSMWPTDNWDFNQKDITNMRRLEVTDRMKIPKKTLGASCDFATESTAFDDVARALMICDKDPADATKFMWLHTRGKGAANWDDYIDVTVEAKPLKPNSKESEHATTVSFVNTSDPKQSVKWRTLAATGFWPQAQSRFQFETLNSSLYGMPVVLQNHTNGYRQQIQDQGCAETASWVNVPLWSAIATVSGGIGGWSSPEGVVGGVFGGGGNVTGWAQGWANGWCSKWKENWQYVSQTPEFKLAVDASSKQWQLYADMKFGGVLTVRFHKLYQ